MKNPILLATVTLLTLVASIPASAANRYLYFLLDEGSTNKVLSVPMEGVYSAFQDKKSTLVCTYTTSAGATAEFTLDGPHCPGDNSISMSMKLDSTTSDGQKIQNYAEGAYVDHKSVYFNSRLNGTNATYPTVGMLVVSASSYAKMNDGAPLSLVTSVAVGSSTNFDRPITGTFGCSLRRVEVQCR